MSEALLWVDIETTGLDVKKDSVIEVAWAATNMRGDRLATSGQCFVSGAKFGRMDDYVTKMHTDNDLVKEYKERSNGWELPWVVHTLNDEAQFLKETEGYSAVHLAGASVHFDRTFLETKSKIALNQLTHRHVDNSSLKLALRSVGRWDMTQKAHLMHRAWPDVQAEIDEYREILRVMGLNQRRVH